MRRARPRVRGPIRGWPLAAFWAHAALLHASPAGAEPQALSPPAGVSELAADATTLVARADSLFRCRQPDAALALLDPLLQASRRDGDIRLTLTVRLEQGEILATVGRAVPAESALREALAAADGSGSPTLSPAETRRATRWLAHALSLQGRSAESSSAYEHVLASARLSGDREHEGYARLGLAHLDLLAGRTRAAVTGFEEALDRFRALGLRGYALMALTGLGRCHDTLGDLDRARSVYNDVARQSRELGDPYSEAHALNNLGALEFSQGDPGVAVELYRRARDLHLHHGNPEGSIIPAKNIATARTYMGQYDDAAAILEETLRLCAEQNYRGHRAIVLEQLGTVRRLQGRHAESITLLQEATASPAGLDLSTRIRAALSLATTLVEMDSVEAALSLLARETRVTQGRTAPLEALRLARLTGELRYHQGAPQQALGDLLRADNAARGLGLHMERIGPLTFGARCYRALGRPDSSLALLRRASEAWEASRARSRDPEWRERLGIDAHLLYIDLGTLLAEYPNDRSAAERAQAAFEAVQRFKARTLHERMTGPDGSSSDSGRTLPRLPVLLADVQQALTEDELLLDVYLGTEASLLFAVTRQTCRVARLPGLTGRWSPPAPAVRDRTAPDQDAGLATRLSWFRELVAHPPEEAGSGGGSAANARFVEAAGAALGDALLAQATDLIAGCRRIIVAPSGPLNGVPLCVLGGPAEAGAGLGRGEALLARHEVVRIPSASLLVELRSRTRAADAKGDGLLALAAGGDAAEVGLPAALAEARWLRERFHDVDLRTPGRRAPRTAELSRYDVLHFATHTRPDDQRPWRSNIIIAPGDSLSGCRLHAADIAALPLAARLVVLSGCESAAGRVLSGEGVLGLTAAFIAAGAPTVIATLWPVQDRVTARLMREFYARAGRGEPVAAALRGAQLAVRADPATRHPFYWAGFVLVGDGDTRVSLRERPAWTRATVPVLAVVLFAVGLVMARRWRGARRSGGTAISGSDRRGRRSGVRISDDSARSRDSQGMGTAMTAGPSDEELAGRFRADPTGASGQDAATELFRRYREQVYLWCFRRVQDHERALDAAQDVLISAYRSLATYEGRALYSSWIFTIMRHRCYRDLRRAGNGWIDDAEPDTLPGRAKTPEALFIEGRDEQQVLELIRAILEPREQLALWLRCFEHVPVDEITRRLQIPGAAGARGVLQGARRKLRAALAARERVER